MSSPSIHLVCFDLGGVLMRLCQNWKHACEVAGVPTLPKDLDDLAKQKLTALVHRSEIGAIDQDAFCREAARYFELDPAHVHALSDAYLLGPFPGAIELIDEINSRGVFTACLSNTNTRHWQLMNDRSHRAGLPLDRLTYRFASQLIGERKPDDAIYEHVERATKLAPNQILFFDDREENIIAAEKRGWRCHQVTSSDDPVAEMRGVLRASRVIE